MIKDIHNEDGRPDAFPIGAEEGWQSMRALLDEQMPAKKRRIAWPAVFKAMMAACLLLAVVKTTDVINNTSNNEAAKVAEPGRKEDGYRAQVAAGTAQPVTTSPHTLVYQPAINTHTRHTYTTTTSQATPNSQTIISAAASGQGTDVVSTPNTPPDGSMFEKPAAGSNEAVTGLLSAAGSEEEGRALIPGNAGQSNSVAALPALAAQPIGETGRLKPAGTNVLPANDTVVNIARPKAAKRNAFGFYAGVQLQSGLQANKELNVAPIAMLQYSMGKNWYLATGVNVYTGSGGAKAQEQSTEAVNDLASNLKEVITTTSYKKLRYVDVPLMAGFKITKNLSVAAGMQASFLVSSRFDKEKQGYDFANRAIISTTGMVDLPPFLAPNPDPVVEVPAKPKRTDLRYVAGLRYDVGRFSAGVQYQRGLQQVMENATPQNTVSSTATQSVNLRLQSRLW